MADLDLTAIKTRADAAIKDMDTSGWWCPRCEMAVPGTQVTYDEVHTACGQPVGDPPPRGENTADDALSLVAEIEKLRAEVAEQQKRIGRQRLAIGTLEREAANQRLLLPPVNWQAIDELVRQRRNHVGGPRPCYFDTLARATTAVIQECDALAARMADVEAENARLGSTTHVRVAVPAWCCECGWEGDEPASDRAFTRLECPACGRPEGQGLAAVTVVPAS